MPDWQKVYTVSYLLGDGGLSCDFAVTDGTDLFLVLRGGDSTDRRLYKYTIATQALDLWLEFDDYDVNNIYGITYFPLDSYLYVAYKDGESIKIAIMTRADVLTDQITVVDMSATVYSLRTYGYHFGQTDSSVRFSVCYDAADEGVLSIVTVYNNGFNIWASFTVEPADLTEIIREKYLADRDLFRAVFGAVESIYEFVGVASFTEIIATNPHDPIIFSQISQRDEDRLIADVPIYYSDDEWANLTGSTILAYDLPILRGCDFDYYLSYSDTTNAYKLGASSLALDGEILTPPDYSGDEKIVRTNEYTYLLAVVEIENVHLTIAIWQRGKDGNYYESQGGKPGRMIKRQLL